MWYPDGRVRRFTPNEVELVQGFPANWTLPQAIKENEAKRIDSLRYHAIGNAVTPTVAEWVGRRLAEAMAKRDRETVGNGTGRRIESESLETNGAFETVEV